MKTILPVTFALGCIAAALATSAAAPAGPPPVADGIVLEDVPPEWRGMFVLGDERRFAVSTPGGTQSAWLAIGESFNDWHLREYREKAETLLMCKEGLEVEVPLAASRILSEKSGAKATIAQAEALMRQMNFDAMFDHMIEQQKKASLAMTRQSMANEKNGANVDPGDMAAFQAKIMDVMWAELKPAEMQAEMARAYAEVFSPAEMQGMAEFYATAAGKATLEKAPEIQERMMQSMMPRLMSALPKIREMAKGFAAEQKAKHEAAAGAGTGGAVNGEAARPASPTP